MFAVLLAATLQGLERPGYVYSIMPQWGHLMVLQNVAANFHLPSVSTANINTVQYPKPYQQYAIPTISAAVISKVLLPQSNIMAAFVRSNSTLFFDVSSCLPKYNHTTKLNFYSVRPLPAEPLTLLPIMYNYQHTAVHFNLSIPHRNVVITSFN